VIIVKNSPTFSDYYKDCIVLINKRHSIVYRKSLLYVSCQSDERCIILSDEEIYHKDIDIYGLYSNK
jgi:hypothetical protein